ncbi:uncharacterized protein A4U43_C07F24360 [Asparagus officinalis]|uniref:Uncharacterized protein n=1 Tax=Asparagus officinalis TaxID=4686 RepID=A0A5P1EJS6_ASPOF|nr:uncharacterized protein A4U43_C07F24360 [Asparagus officinalis]
MESRPLSSLKSGVHLHDSSKASSSKSRVSWADEVDKEEANIAMAGRYVVARDQQRAQSMVRGSGSVHVEQKVETTHNSVSRHAHETVHNSVSGHAHTPVQGAHSAGSFQVMARLSSSVHDKQSFKTALNSMSGHAHNHMSQHVKVMQPEAGQSNLWFQSRKKRSSKEKEYNIIQVAGSSVHVV